jgi:HSP20 family protein
MSVTSRSLTRDLVLVDFLSLGSRLSQLMNDGLGSAAIGSCATAPARRGCRRSTCSRSRTRFASWPEIPGVSPADVKITLENTVLTIRGSKQRAAGERTERVHRYERTYGAFERTFTLPTTGDASNIKPSYEHGVLTVTLPKVEKAKPREIAVQVTAK